MSVVTTNDTAELKAALAERAISFCAWLFPAGKRCAGNYLVGSVRGEPGQSLSIRLEGPKAGVWKDFATNQGGSNLLELLRVTRDISFEEACNQTRAWLGQDTRQPAQSSLERSRQLKPIVPSSGKPYVLSEHERLCGAAMAERLIGNPAAVISIAKWRKWQPQTVLDLACEASLGLTDQGQVAFLYDTCVKWREIEDVEKKVCFAFGNADSLWRGGLLPIAQRVFILEGETDAISLIDAGAERDGGTLVVALPSASTIRPHWTEQLASKDVLLCMDADEPGWNALGKLTDLLTPCVNSLQICSLEGLLQ